MATCESCGGPDETVFAVRRVYITLRDGDTSRTETTLDEVERWCFACCAQYPHVPA